jgi:hypothetical protein
MHFGEECTELVRLFEPELQRALVRFWQHPRLREMVGDYFLQLYAAVRGILHVMEVALQTATLRKHEDAAAAGLAVYLERHLAEERGHDLWLLEDVKHLGLDPRQVVSDLPSPTLACLLGAQYFWVHHHHPVAVLGYIAVVEMNPPTVAALEEVIERASLPRGAFRTLFEHAELDPQHGADLRQCLDELPLTDDQRALVRMNICRTIHMFTQHYTELVTLAESRPSPRRRSMTARK